MIRTLRAALADPFLDNLGRVVVPTLVIRGQWDRVAPQRWAEEAGGRLRSARVVVVPGVAHTVVYSAPSELAGLVAEFAGGGHGPPDWFPGPNGRVRQRLTPLRLWRQSGSSTGGGLAPPVPRVRGRRHAGNPTLRAGP